MCSRAAHCMKDAWEAGNGFAVYMHLSLHVNLLSCCKFYSFFVLFCNWCSLANSSYPVARKIFASVQKRSKSKLRTVSQKLRSRRHVYFERRTAISVSPSGLIASGISIKNVLLLWKTQTKNRFRFPRRGSIVSSFPVKNPPASGATSTQILTEVSARLSHVFKL